MRFASAASGIEAPSVAWEPLGFESAWFSEIDPFCCSLLHQRHGKTPNLGDMNAITTHALRRRGRIDALIAGTPCQSFSIGGLRGGLADPRGQLAIRLLDLVEYTKPTWFVWENVPGALSSWTGPTPPSDLAAGQEWEAEETSDFGFFLAALSQLGIGWAYRVYDAQYAGVPQRRRRIFLVGHSGDWRRAAQVLFEPDCVSGDYSASGRPQKETAGAIVAGTRGRGRQRVKPDHVGTLCSNNKAAGSATNQDAAANLLLPIYAIQERAVSENLSNGPQGKGFQESIAYTLEARHHSQAVAFGGNNTSGPISVATACNTKGGTRFDFETETLIAYRTTGNSGAWSMGDKVDTLTTGTDPSSHVLLQREVRRFTPLEYERLQGFPDNYTLITHRGKPAGRRPAI